MIALFPTDPPFASLQRRTVQTRCDENQIKFHGHAIGVNGVRALLSVAPYAADVKVSSALKSMEDVSKKLNVRIMLMATTKQHFPNSTDAAIGAFKELVECLRSSLLFKDITKDAHINKDFLVGTRSKVVWFFFSECSSSGVGGFREGVLMISGHLHIFFRWNPRISGLQDFLRSELGDFCTAGTYHVLTFPSEPFGSQGCKDINHCRLSKRKKKHLGWIRANLLQTQSVHRLSCSSEFGQR